jgi:hypothetical protein
MSIQNPLSSPVVGISGSGSAPSISPSNGPVGTTFSVPAATGATYQWSLNGSPISGATSSSYTTTTAGTLTCDITVGGATVTTPIVLVALTLSSTSFSVGLAAGTALATIIGKTSGSAIAIAGSDTSGVFAVNSAGTQLLAGINYPSSGSSTPTVKLNETYGNATNSPKETDIAVTIAARPIQATGVGGMVPNAVATVSGTKTRLKGYRTYTLGNNPSTEIALAFSNWYISSDATAENSIPVGNTLQKIGIVINGIEVPITFASARSRAMAAGETLFFSDTLFPSSFGLTQFAAGQTVQYRFMMDVATSGLTYATTQGREAILLEAGYIYDPAVTPGDDIDSTSAMTVPSGATTLAFCPFKPVMIVGRFTTKTVSKFTLGDSKADGVGDFPAGSTFGSPATTLSGGSWMRRADFAAGIAYTNCTLTSRAVANYASNHAKTVALYPYHSDGVNELGINDASSNATTVQTNLRGIWADMKAGGIKRVVQVIFGTETTSTDHFSTVANQTALTAFTSSGNAATIRANIAADLSAGTHGLDATFDERPVLCDGTDPTKWAVTGFSTTITSAFTNTLTQFASMANPPRIGALLYMDPTAAQSAANVGQVSAVSGSGSPYTVTCGGVWNPFNAKTSGTAVVEAASAEGVHPSPAGHAALATAWNAQQVSSYVGM